MERRFGSDAEVHYRNVETADARTQYASIVTEIETRGLIYPVTVIDGTPVYDGAVSYPAIMRAVNNKLLERAESTS